MLGGQDILAHHAAQQPTKVALVDESGRSVTYAELNARVNRACAVFQALGLRRGDRCVSVQYNSIAGFEIAHALRKLQAVSTPMNYRLRGQEIAYILNDSGAKVVVAGPEFTAVVDEARPAVEDAEQRRWLVLGDGPAPPGWELFEELMAAASEEEPPPPPGITGPSMIYTAGTTGHPKGAYRPQGTGPEVALQWIGAFGLTPDDVHLLAGPGYHSAPGAFAGLQQILGATCVVLRRFDAERALQLIDRYRVSTTFMAPIMVKRILDLPEEVRRRYDVSSMRVLIVAAAPFPADLKRRAVEYFGNSVYEFYGATETGIVTLIGPDDLLRKPQSCGRPFPGVEIRLLDDAGNEVGVGEPGEVWVRSPQLLDEYFNKPEATERNRRDGFFSVGDVAYRDEDGYLYICDRKVDMIISGGVNIYPAEVEAVLGTHPAVQDCAVIGVPDPEWGEAVKAVVQLRPGATATAEELIAHCADRLADYKRPRSVDIVDDLPRDAAGKLLKRQLRDRYWTAVGRRV
jgi:acyl-CoA synthetase (AMP-forming)/AMP-acid ligase II